MLTDDIDRGYTKFLDGEFTPVQVSWDEPFSDLVDLKARPRLDLHNRVREAGVERAAELGWKPRPSHVAISYLLDLYGITIGSK